MSITVIAACVIVGRWAGAPNVGPALPVRRPSSAATTTGPGHPSDLHCLPRLWGAANQATEIPRARVTDDIRWSMRKPETVRLKWLIVRHEQHP